MTPPPRDGRPDVAVRPAVPADARALAQLRWAFKREDHEQSAGQPAPPAGGLEDAERWIHDRLAGGQWLAWVAGTADDGLCGHVFLCQVERVPEPYGENTPVGYVTNFYVTPSHRNRGTGTALLDALKRHCRRTGFDTLIVWPSERSDPLYRRSGFGPPEELRELPLEE